MRVRKISLLLWTAQVLLAALFMFAGWAKLTLPAEALRGPVPLPVGFLRFIGAMEILGAFGLLLPGLLRIRRELTPLAGIGLLIIVTGATVITLIGGQVGPAVLPFAAGVIAALVVYGRRDWLQAGALVVELAAESSPSLGAAAACCLPLDVSSSTLSAVDGAQNVSGPRTTLDVKVTALEFERGATPCVQSVSRSSVRPQECSSSPSRSQRRESFASACVLPP